jgi:hypothetical protein
VTDPIVDDIAATKLFHNDGNNWYLNTPVKCLKVGLIGMNTGSSAKMSRGYFIDVTNAQYIGKRINKSRIATAM